jgi:hypothetical protein
VANLLQRLTAGAFYDHGPSADTSAEQQKTFKAYESALANQHREVIKPGDTIPIKGLEVTVMVAGGAHIDRKGEANPYCSGVAPQANDIAENAQSAGVLIQYGKFRFADFGDLTWNKEIELLCPENRVGKLDVFVSDHHGGETAPVIHALAPRVVVMNNGARKGGDPRGWKTLKESPGLEDLWQLHFAMAGGQGANSSDTVIANVEEHCEGKYLKLSAESSGAFTILNSRNKYTKTYAAK